MLKNVQTSFAFITFYNYKGHYCPTNLLGGLIVDIETRGGELRQIEEIIEGTMDLPGMCMIDRPWEDLMIGDFKFSIPSQDFECILSELERVVVRRFSNGQEYFKIHGNYHCLVLTPTQRNSLLQIMHEMLDDVRRRAEEADEEISRRIAWINKRTKTGIISKMDKNVPVIRISNPPKDNN